MKENIKKIIITILIIVSIFTIFFESKIFINKKEEKLPEVRLREIKSNKNFAIMIETENNKYKEYQEEGWPGIGYIYNKSECINNVGQKVDNALNFNEDTRTIELETEQTISCTLYFEKNKTLIVDKSGNNFNGHLLNGAVIKQDDEGQKGLYLDGIEAYVDVDDLPDSIDWASGFTIEFEAKWLALNFWSRIIDFSNGLSADNILIGNMENSNNLVPSLRYESVPNEKVILDVVQIGEKNRYKVLYQKNDTNYLETFYKNDNFIESVTYETNNMVRNVLRTQNYIGKSAWENDENFYGYIYYLKITDSNGIPILWYDFTK